MTEQEQLNLEQLEVRWVNLIEQCGWLEDLYSEGAGPEWGGDAELENRILTCRSLIDETFEQMVNIDLLTLQALDY